MAVLLSLNSLNGNVRRGESTFTLELENYQCILRILTSLSILNFSKDLEERLPKTKLTILCNYQPVLDYVKDADHVLYQTLVETLIPEVLRPIPGK